MIFRDTVTIMRYLYAKYRKVFWYLVSGGTAFLVNISLLALFVEAFHLWYLIATSLAFMLAFFVSFTMQKFLTFREHSTDRVHRQMGAYLLIALCNLCANGGLMYIAVEFVGIHYLVAQVIVTAAIAAYSFFLYKYLIFERRAQEV